MTATEIAERYIKECKQDMEALNIKPATHQPRATEEIGGMIKMIQTLIEKGMHMKLMELFTLRQDPLKIMENFLRKISMIWKRDIERSK